VRDRTLIVVPARGGSRRIARKNLVPIAGIPLVGWAVRTGRRAAAAMPGGPHQVVCSTDDAEIAAVAAAWGATIVDRPAELAADAATSIDVVRQAVATLAGHGASFDTVVLLQPTSPLTEPADVAAAVALHRERGTGVVTVARSHPARWHGSVGDGGAFVAAGATGATDDRLLTGAAYVVAVADLEGLESLVVSGRTLVVEVAAERSIDIDEPSDLRLAEGLLAARPTPRIGVGDREIGGDAAFVIAEAGVNHDGDLAIAHRLVDAAADAGADAVKFQTFRPAALASAGAPMAAYQVAAGETGAEQAAMLARLALPDDAWPSLRDHAHERGIGFLSTPFDDASADLLEALDVPAFKVGSGELTNLPFLARLAERGRPMLVSTGMADMREVADAVDTIAAHGDPPLALLHCVSSYPADAADANLRAIETLRRAFAVPVGWSDHTLGDGTALAATALGASIIEKHLTLDRGRSGPDHAASLEPMAFAAMVAGIRLVTSALGDGTKARTPAEEDVAVAARRSLHWSRDLPTGSTIGVDDLVALRPGTGVPPARLTSIAGRRLARNVSAGSAVRPDDVDGPA
jgi:N-acetylneuraminate synthase/N,N'-diacetyllegionaminate synthase